MRKNILTFVGLTIAASLLAPQMASACLEIPKAITIKNSSFRSLKHGSNCQVRITVANQSFNFNEFAEFKSGPIFGPGGKAIAMVEKTETNLFVFSVDAAGNKDLKQTYLRIAPDAAGATTGKHVVVDAVRNSKTVGRMDLVAGACSRSFAPPSAGVADFELEGSSFTQSGAGCKSGLEQSPFVSEGASERAGETQN